MQSFVPTQFGSAPESRLAQFRRAPSIDSGICCFLANHPASPALLVAQGVWAEAREIHHDLHVDSWLWIRERMELLATEGILRSEERGGVRVWSLNQRGLKAAA